MGLEALCFRVACPNGIFGCLQPIQLSWLPVLSNVASPSLHRKAASDNVLQIIEAHPNWPVYADVFEHPPPRLASRRPIQYGQTLHLSTQLCSGEDLSSASVVNRTIVTTLLSDSQVSISFIIRVSDEPFQDKTHVMLTCTNGA